MLNPLTSRLVRLEQPLNIWHMVVTSSVLRCSIPVMEARLLMPENHL